MTPSQEAANVLEEWLGLTRREASLIDASDWAGLRQIHDQKAALREKFEAAARRCAEAGVAAESLSAAAAPLLSLLGRNQRVLGDRLAGLRRRQTVLRDQQRNLLRIRLSYARPGARRRWQSYS